MPKAIGAGAMDPDKDRPYIDVRSIPIIAENARAKVGLHPKGQEIGHAATCFEAEPKKAKSLMAAAGFPNGLDVRYIFTNNAYGERFNQWGEAVSAMLKDGGLRTQIIVQDYNREYIAPDGTFFGRYDGIFFGLETPFPDAPDYLFNMLHSQSRRNHAGVSDPQLDAMIDKGRRDDR